MLRRLALPLDQVIGTSSLGCSGHRHYAVPAKAKVGGSKKKAAEVSRGSGGRSDAPADGRIEVIKKVSSAVLSFSLCFFGGKRPRRECRDGNRMEEGIVCRPDPRPPKLNPVPLFSSSSGTLRIRPHRRRPSLRARVRRPLPRSTRNDHASLGPTPTQPPRVTLLRAKSQVHGPAKRPFETADPRSGLV